MSLSNVIMIILRITTPIVFITAIITLFRSGATSSTRPYSSIFAQTLKPVIKAAIVVITATIIVSIIIIFSTNTFLKTEIDCKPMSFVTVKNLQNYMTFEETVVTKDRFQEIPIGDFTVTTTDATEGDFIVASSEEGLIACMMGSEHHYKMRDRSKTYVDLYKDQDGNFHYIPSTKEAYNLYKEGKYSGAKNYMQQIRTTYIWNDKITIKRKIVPYLYKTDESLKYPFILR